MKLCIYIYIYKISLRGYTEVAGSMMMIPVHSLADEPSVRRSDCGGASLGVYPNGQFNGDDDEPVVDQWIGVAYFQTKP